MINQELKKYYENRFSMMSSDGWNDLIIDVEIMFDATNRLDGIDDEKSLQFKKGEVSIMRWILTLKENSRIAYEQLKEEK